MFAIGYLMRPIGALVLAIQASPLWTAPGNSAIVVTWDEDSGKKLDANGESAGLLRL